MPTEPWDITSNDELREAVRTETQYGTNELSMDDLKGLVQSAKRVLALQADVTTFYDDRGIAVALLGITCAKAKGAVENSPVVVDNVAGQDVRFRESDGDSLQLGQYEQMTEMGLSNSSQTDAGPKNIRFTRTFLSDNSTG